MHSSNKRCAGALRVQVRTEVLPSPSIGDACGRAPGESGLRAVKRSTDTNGHLLLGAIEEPRGAITASISLRSGSSPCPDRLPAQLAKNKDSPCPSIV